MTIVSKISFDTSWASKQKMGLQAGLLELSTDILTKAKILAPVATRNLVNSGKIKSAGKMAYMIGFGDSKVPYARRRHFENKKHPATTEYLAKAGDAVVRTDKSKYFRNKI